MPIFKRGDTCGSGTCTCYIVTGNESYWDGSKCQQAKDLGQACSADTQCKTMTQITTCIAN